MQRTVEGTHALIDYVAFILIIYTQATRESRNSAVLNEWEKTCLPPRNEEVSKL